MRSVFTATVSISGVSTQKTLLYLTSPSSMVIELLAISITSGDSTTASSEQLKSSIFRITSLSPTPSATAMTPVGHESGSGSSLADVFGDVISNEPTYATDPIWSEAWLNLSGFFYEPIPETRIFVPPSGSIGLKMTKTPTTPFACTATITYREIG